MRLMAESPIVAIRGMRWICGWTLRVTGGTGRDSMVGWRVFQIFSHLKNYACRAAGHSRRICKRRRRSRIEANSPDATRRAHRMMEDVPKADVIVTNPTHYSAPAAYGETK